jgi:hypothetical protein
MADTVVPLRDLLAAGYTLDELRQLGVVIRSGHDREPVCNRHELAAVGIILDDTDDE